MLDDAFAAVVGDLLLPSFSRSPARHARRLARRYAGGEVVECDAYVAPTLDSPAEFGRLRLCAGGPTLWRPRPEGRRLPWRELTLLQTLGSSWLHEGSRPRYSAYGWRVVTGDGADAVLLIDSPYGARFTGLLRPVGEPSRR